jgi:Domain of unknown function (DUF4352)
MTYAPTYGRRPRGVILATALAGVVLVGCGDLDGSTGGNGGSGDGTTEVGIGDKARDGQFTFTVKSVECGKRSIGSGFTKEKAQGQYCLVNVTVKNTGNEPQLMDSSSSTCTSGTSSTPPAAMRSLAIDESQNFFLQEINPGNSVKGIIVFDIPKGGQPDRLELHDSPFSGGVTVTL